jgi:hypothetical protein
MEKNSKYKPSKGRQNIINLERVSPPGFSGRGRSGAMMIDKKGWMINCVILRLF